MMQLLLSVGFGIGVAGMVSAGLTPKHSLISRLTSRTIRKSEISKISVKDRLFEFVRKTDSQRLRKAIFELPDILDLLAVRLASGEAIFPALEQVSKRASGELAQRLVIIIRAAELGGSLAEEIDELPKRFPHPLIAEFANKISLSLNRGTPLAEMLDDLSQSARAELKHRLMRLAGKNETRMLIPLVFLILPITVLFAIYPSLRLLALSF